MTNKIIKILSICLSVIILGIPLVTVSAAETDEHILTIICRLQDETFSLDDYDEISVRMLNKNTGKTNSFTLYGYNKFIDKIMVKEGDYLITEISVKTQKNVVLLNENPLFSVSDNTSLIIPLVSAKSTIIKESTTEVTSYYNPFEQNSSMTTTVPNGNENSTKQDSNETYTFEYIEENTTESPSKYEQETTTEDPSSNDANVSDYIIFAILIVLIILGILVYVAIRKRNK